MRRLVGEIAFTAPYILIEGGYLVPAGSPLQRIEDVDRAGVRVASENAYDLYLSRTLKHAQLVHAPSSPGAIELFVSEKLDAAAGVKQQLLAFAKTHRMCTGRFMAIEQPMGTPKAGMWEPVIFVRSSRRPSPIQ